MSPTLAADQTRGWNVTQDKVDEAIRRIIAVSDPLQVIVFGSRARGDHRPDSDIDLAVILDCPEPEVDTRLPCTSLKGLRMDVSLIVVSKVKYDLHRPWRNSIFNYIEREGIVLYDRQDSGRTRSGVVHTGPGRRERVGVPPA